MRKQSSYCECIDAPRGRKFGAKFLDYLLCGVLSILFYFGGRAIADATPSVKSLTASLQSQQKELTTLVLNTHLAERGEDGLLLSQNTLANQFVLSLVKGSLLHNGTNESALSSIYSNVTPASATSDRVCYYYVTYKPAHAESFETLGGTGESYYRDQLTKGYEDYFVEKGYPFLSDYQAKALDEGLRNADYSLGTEIKNQLTSRYVELLQNGAKEFESSYVPYLEMNQKYEMGISAYLQIQTAVVLLSCLLASLLYFGLSPWIFQNGQTPADKSFQLFYEDQGLEPGVRFKLFRLLFGVIDFGLLTPFVLVLSSGAAGLEILAQGKVGYLPLWACPLISLGWAGFRYLFSLIRKDHITFLEWAGKAREVDGRSVEINRNSK